MVLQTKRPHEVVKTGYKERERKNYKRNNANRFSPTMKPASLQIVISLMSPKSCTTIQLAETISEEECTENFSEIISEASPWSHPPISQVYIEVTGKRKANIHLAPEQSPNPLFCRLSAMRHLPFSASHMKIFTLDSNRDCQSSLPQLHIIFIRKKTWKTSDIVVYVCCFRAIRQSEYEGIKIHKTACTSEYTLMKLYKLKDATTQMKIETGSRSKLIAMQLISWTYNLLQYSSIYYTNSS